MKISFCHYGNTKMASYRYRVAIPAKEMGAQINNPKADVMICCKPNEQDIPYTIKARADGRTVIMDFCDLHFDNPMYVELLKLADGVTVATQWMADYIRDEYGILADVVIDPYLYDEVEPHWTNGEIMWFGHALNFYSVERIIATLPQPLRVVSNFDGAIPWSEENVLAEMALCDIVIMPETAPYKSPNRTIEAIRRGCFVVAEPHPSINNLPGIWIGNIRKGIEWAQQNPLMAQQRTQIAQAFIRKHYSPATQASAWRAAIQKAQSSSIAARDLLTGPDGPESICPNQPMSIAM
mgnify:CR=1 FL=1